MATTLEVPTPLEHAESGTTRPGGATARTAALWSAALSPLCWLPGGFSRFVLAKLLVVALATLVAVVAPPPADRAARLPRPLLAVGGVWVIVFVAAALAGATPLASLIGRWPRYEGLPVLALYAGAVWIGVRTVAPSEAGAAATARAVAVLAVVLGILSALDVVGLSPMGEAAARDGSVLGNASDQGAVAMLATLVLGGRLLRLPGRLGRGGRREHDRRPGPRPLGGDASARVIPLEPVGLVAAAATVAISGSRTALLLTVLGLVALALTGRRRVASTLLLTGSVLAAMLAVVLAVASTRHRLLGLATGHARLEQWRLTARLVGDHLGLGLGGSRYLDVFPAYESPGFVRFTGPGTLADSPHDVLLQVLVTGGVPLLTVTLVGLVLVVRRASAALRAHPERAPAAVAVAAYLVFLGVNVTAAGPVCLAALLLGHVLAMPAPQDRVAARGSAPARLAALVALSALVVVLAAACVGDVRLRQGVDAAADGDVGAATTRIDQAQAWRPWDSDVAMLGSQALAGAAGLGDPRAARAAVDLAHASLDRTPASHAAQLARGVALIELGRLGTARRVLAEVVRTAPFRADGWVQAAIASYGHHDTTTARTDLRRARALAPHDPVIPRLLAGLGDGRLPGHRPGHRPGR